VFQKKKYRGKYLKISNEKKNLLKDWLSKVTLINEIKIFFCLFFSYPKLVNFKFPS